jgi:hypothetical protein
MLSVFSLGVFGLALRYGMVLYCSDLALGWEACAALKLSAMMLFVAVFWG